ncbi:MAG TPA: glycosyltransferase family 2 protein [Pedobacter sp.]|jgi:hypothetical protein
MDVSVIIVSYNTYQLTVECIHSVIKYTQYIEYEILVIDNNSSDGSSEKIKQRFPEVTVIQNKKNIGFGQANNLGVLNSRGKYVFFFNSDAYLTDNALKAFFDFMEQAENARVACCGGALFQANGLPQISYGNFPSLLEAVSDLGFYRFYKKYFQQHISSGVINYSNQVREVDYISGADMFIRRTALDIVGLFDKDFFLYFEETELSIRFKRAGFLSIFLPHVKIIHLEGASIKPGIDFNYAKLEQFAKSRVLFFRKCYGTNQARLMKFLYCWHTIILFILNRRGDLKKTMRIIANA